MANYKIYVYAICKNEEKFVERWMNSMSEADGIIVTDTGSADGTVEKLRAMGAVVYEETVVPWRFDTARNLSLTHVPEDADICVCTDLDEVFEEGWREKLENAWSSGVNRGNYWYNWSLKDDGTPDVQFVYFKVHTKENYIWEAPVHEYLRYTGETPEKKVFVNGMTLNHYPNRAKSRGSYLPLLELAVKEKPDSERNMYYLGREYFYNKKWDKCINTLMKHLSMPTSKWKEERCASMRWIAKAYHELGNKKESYGWFYRAVAECPDMRDAYVECAKTAYAYKDWQRVLFFTQEALKIKEKSSVYVNMGYAWDHTPYDLAGLACYWLGMYKKSFQYFQDALSLKPQDERLLKNLRFAQEKAGSI